MDASNNPLAIGDHTIEDVATIEDMIGTMLADDLASTGDEAVETACEADDVETDAATAKTGPDAGEIVVEAEEIARRGQGRHARARQRIGARPGLTPLARTRPWTRRWPRRTVRDQGGPGQIHRADPGRGHDRPQATCRPRPGTTRRPTSSRFPPSRWLMGRGRAAGRPRHGRTGIGAAVPGHRRTRLRRRSGGSHA